ncbi:MAG: hypothetical protein VKJ04_08950 [Vampirovibrionales bacterium]|nr:hypothetical protein [Vampirovibrionales bacterium]
MDLITSLTSQLLGKSMDGLSKRHTAISSNLANVETPGYRRQDVQFEGELKKALHAEKQKMSVIDIPPENRQASNDEALEMASTRKEHFGGTSSPGLSGFSPVIGDAQDFLSFRNDGNSVDLENEMAQLAKNTQRYTALANIQGRRGKALRNVLNS